MLFELHLPRRLGRYDRSQEKENGDIVMEIFLSSTGRLKPFPSSTGPRLTTHTA